MQYCCCGGRRHPSTKSDSEDKVFEVELKWKERGRNRRSCCCYEETLVMAWVIQKVYKRTIFNMFPSNVKSMGPRWLLEMGFIETTMAVIWWLLFVFYGPKSRGELIEWAISWPVILDLLVRNHDGWRACVCVSLGRRAIIICSVLN